MRWVELWARIRKRGRKTQEVRLGRHQLSLKGSSAGGEGLMRRRSSRVLLVKSMRYNAINGERERDRKSMESYFEKSYLLWCVHQLISFSKHPAEFYILFKTCSFLPGSRWFSVIWLQDENQPAKSLTLLHHHYSKAPMIGQLVR